VNQLPPAVKTVLSSDTAGGMTSSSLATLTSVDPLDNQGQTMRAKTPPKTPPQTPPQTPLRIVLAIQEPEESGSQEPQDPLLLPISSEASPTWDPCERRKKIAFLIGVTILASLAGIQFGFLSVEEATSWTEYLYRFIPSTLVNFMGAGLAMPDAIELFKKLKKNPETGLRDLAAIGPFIPASVLMGFAVISTVPLAKDSTEGLFGSSGSLTKALSLNDSTRMAFQIIGQTIWCLGYTAPTRIDTGYAIMRELYEDTLMRYFQSYRHTQVMLARDLKKFKTTVFVGVADPVLTLAQIKEFYSEVKKILDAQAENPSWLPTADTVLTMARRTLMVGCVPVMGAVLQDTSERGMSELLELNGLALVVMGGIAALAALIFFIRSSQLLFARLVETFKRVRDSFIKKEYSPIVAEIRATMCAIMCMSLSIGIAFGSSFGWIFEAAQFRQGSSVYNKFTFPGYEAFVGVYGGGANLGFESNYINGILALSDKHQISVPEAIIQRSTGLYKLDDKRPSDVVVAEKRLKKLAEGTGLASGVSAEEVRQLREAALHSSSERCSLFGRKNNSRVTSSAAGPTLGYGSVNDDESTSSYHAV